MAFSPMHAIHIDPRTGTVQLDGVPRSAPDGASNDESLLLERHMLAGQARSSLGALVERTWNHHNGYDWMGLGGRLRFAERPASLALCFFEGRLTMLTLGISLPDDEDVEGWPTEATSLRQVAFLRRALAKRLGVPMETGGAEFPWGAVWARFDPKGFMASAGLRYDPGAERGAGGPGRPGG